MSKTIGFTAYEVIGIGLPNMYQCVRCHRLINCIHPPGDQVCSWCSGVPNDYEQLAVRAIPVSSAVDPKEEEKDSRGYPIEFMKRQTQWYMDHKGYSESDARLAAEAGYDQDLLIFQCLDRENPKT